MKFSLFYHSLVSDWNHGNAHFLRGVVGELLDLGHEVQVFEPADAWSRANLVADHGEGPIQEFHQQYPGLSSTTYEQDSLDLEQIAAQSDVVIVHEWNEAWLVNELGALRNRVQRGSNAELSFKLLFHDTHHRAVSDAQWLQRFELANYDGILAFGDVLSQVYRDNGWSDYVWTWHEAADTTVFYPREPNDASPKGDVVWIGNWGDDERTKELDTFLFSPVRNLSLSCHIYGVRYPQSVLSKLQEQGIDYCGWLPNFRAPDVFANHGATVHVPRRFYTQSLPGIPTIRPFEAMACGIPLISAPWLDSERLFNPGRDYLVAHTSAEMQQHLHTVLNDKDFAEHMAAQALSTIRERHTCRHRVEQLLQIIDTLGASPERDASPYPSRQADYSKSGSPFHA